MGCQSGTEAIQNALLVTGDTPDVRNIAVEFSPAGRSGKRSPTAGSRIMTIVSAATILAVCAGHAAGGNICCVQSGWMPLLAEFSPFVHDGQLVLVGILEKSHPQLVFI